MRKYGAYLVDPEVYANHESKIDKMSMEGSIIKSNNQIEKKWQNNRVRIDNENYSGFPTPSKRQEIYSQTVVDFGYPEHATPGYRIKKSYSS